MAADGTDRSPLLPSDREVRTSRDDALDFAHYVKGLSALLAQVETPFVLAVYGDWGAGKTSLMRLLKEDMEQHKYLTVWFNPWKYDGRETVWKALVRGVYARVRRELGFTRFGREHIRQVVRNSGLALGRAVLNSLSPDTSGAHNPADEVEALLSLDRTFFESFEVIFNDLLGQALDLKYTEGDSEDLRAKLARSPRRLVVFLDDLDRCSPDTVVEVLEALKLYLDREGCIFVVGMDPEPVRGAVERRYGGQEEQQVDGHRYLEKIVHLPFHLPRPDAHKLKGFLGTLDLGEKNCPCGIEEADRPKWGEYVGRAAQVHRGNPRQIKRFVLSACLAAQIAPESLDRLKLAKIVLLQCMDPAFFRSVSLSPDLLYQTQQWARDLSEGKPFDPQMEGTQGDRLLRERSVEEGERLFTERRGLRDVLADEPWLERDEIRRYLEFSGDTGQPEPGFAELQTALLHGDGAAQVHATRAIREGPEQTRAAHALRLLQTLYSVGEPDDRVSVIRALTYIRAREAVPDLRKLLGTDREAIVRGTAAQALSLLGAQDSADALRNALREDPVPAVRASAAGALGWLEVHEAAADLLGALRQDQESVVRARAARALGWMRTDEARADLQQALRHDPNSGVRAAAAVGLMKLRAQEAVGDLLEALVGDNTAAVRIAAC